MPATRPRADDASRHEPDRGPLLGALLRRCHQALILETVHELDEAGHGDVQVQPSQNAIMRPLWDHPEGVRATDLAGAARITKQSVGAILDQLEGLGYVERVDDPEDRRAKLVRLTRKGREAGRLTRAAVRRVEAGWAKRIGATRLAALRATLEDLLVSLEMDA